MFINLHAALHCFMVIMTYALQGINVLRVIMLYSLSRQPKMGNFVYHKAKLGRCDSADSNLFLFEFSLIYFVYFPYLTVLLFCKIKATNKIIREVPAMNLFGKIGFYGFRFLRFSLAPPGIF